MPRLSIVVLTCLFCHTLLLVTKSATFAQAAGSGHVLAQESSSAHNATSREEELRQVRLRQQEIANERALEAAKARKERENKEKERKNNVAKSASTAGPGDKLGGTMKSSSSSSASTGYNPMQPWTSNTSRYQ